MSQGLGSLLSPKGKLVQPRLRLKYAHPRRTAFEESTSGKHKPRPSMPDLGRSEAQMHTSASERAISSRNKQVRARAAAKPNDLAALAAEKRALLQEIAELQLRLREGERIRRRPEAEELERRLKDVTQTAGETRREVEQYKKAFQRIYRNVLQQDDFTEDVQSLKYALERSSTLRPRSLQPSPRLPAALSDLLHESYLTLSAWKRAVS